MVDLLFKLRRIIRILNFKLKGQLLKLFFISCGCKVGERLICKKWPIFRTYPNRNIIIGDDVIIGYFITFDVITPGTLRIGDRVELSHNIILGSLSQIAIGNDCLIGENVSIRDDDHQFNKDIRINAQGWEVKSVSIEDDVWIGAHSLILSGAKVSRGAVIGANSVVLDKSNIQSYCIYAGSPVRLIGKR